jgi:hypothetical protein
VPRDAAHLGYQSTISHNSCGSKALFEIQASEIREHLALHENAISCTYEEANAELKGRDISDHTAKVIAVTCKQGPKHPPSNG